MNYARRAVRTIALLAAAVVAGVVEIATEYLFAAGVKPGSGGR